MSSNKKFETLIEDIYTLLDRGMELTDEQANAFGQRMAEFLKRELTAPREEAPYLRFSMLGKSDSYIWHEMKGSEGEKLTPVERMKFLYGHMIEELVLSLAEFAGHKVEDRQKEVEIEGVKGHMDAKIDDVVVDVKSASAYSFQKFLKRDLGSDSFGYLTQLSGYISCNGSNFGNFLAIDKSSGEMTAMEVSGSMLVDVSSRIKHIKKMLAGNEPPTSTCVIKKSVNGNEYLGSPCTYCKHKRNCHPDLRVYQYSNGPCYFTKIVKEPRVEEIT